MVILFDRFNLGDIYDVIFSTSQQSNVARALVKYFKENDYKLNKSQMSSFATKLHEGKLKAVIKIKNEVKELTLSYNKRQFYDRILTPMRTMGLVDYDMFQKLYILSKEFVNEMGRIAKLWEEEFERKD